MRMKITMLLFLGGGVTALKTKTIVCTLIQIANRYKTMYSGILASLLEILK